MIEEMIEFSTIMHHFDSNNLKYFMSFPKSDRAIKAVTCHLHPNMSTVMCHLRHNMLAVIYHLHPDMLAVIHHIHYDMPVEDISNSFLELGLKGRRKPN
jgi:hypothetical protein